MGKEYSKGKKTNTICLVLLFFLTSMLSNAFASSLFPTTDELFGTYMPAISSVCAIKPTVIENSDGIIEEYAGFSDDDYYSFDAYLFRVGCTVDNYSVEDNKMRVEILRNEGRFRFIYDRKSKLGRVEYLGNTRPEKEKANVDEIEGGILPSLEKNFGLEMPDINIVLHRSGEETVEAGEKRVEYKDVTLNEYYTIGKHFQQYDYKLISTKIDDRVIVLSLGLANYSIVVKYNVDSKVLAISLPDLYYYTANSIEQETESLFPHIQEMMGTMLPRIVTATGLFPIKVETLSNGSRKESYDNFTEKDYSAFSQYLKEQECTVVNYTNEDALLTINLAKDNSPFTFVYNSGKKEATVIYPIGSRLEPDITPTPAPTPEPTATPAKQYTAAEIIEMFGDDCWKAAERYFYGLSWNNPNSVTIHGHTVTMYDDWNMLFTIDYSAQNRMGGYTRKNYFIVVDIFSKDIVLALDGTN